MNRGTVRDGKRSGPRKSSSSASFHGDLVIAAGKRFFHFRYRFLLCFAFAIGDSERCTYYLAFLGNTSTLIVPPTYNLYPLT